METLLFEYNPNVGGCLVMNELLLGGFRLDEGLVVASLHAAASAEPIPAIETASSIFARSTLGNMVGIRELASVYA